VLDLKKKIDHGGAVLHGDGSNRMAGFSDSDVVGRITSVTYDHSGKWVNAFS